MAISVYVPWNVPFAGNQKQESWRLLVKNLTAIIYKLETLEGFNQFSDFESIFLLFLSSVLVSKPTVHSGGVRGVGFVAVAVGLSPMQWFICCCELDCHPWGETDTPSIDGSITSILSKESGSITATPSQECSDSVPSQEPDHQSQFTLWSSHPGPGT